MCPDQPISDESGAPEEPESARPEAEPAGSPSGEAAEQPTDASEPTAAPTANEPGDHGTTNQPAATAASEAADNPAADNAAADNAAADSAGAIPSSDSNAPADPSRRGFLSMASSVAMGAGLVAGYGTFFGYLGRFLYPADAGSRSWMYVAKLSEISPDSSLTWKTPTGQKVVVVRRGEGKDAAAFTAFSSVCPHLGCQVHWEPHNSRFFCPCHNGVFDPSGKATGGPPGDAGQSLVEFPIKIENGLLFIEVSLETLNA